MSVNDLVFITFNNKRHKYFVSKITDRGLFIRPLNNPSHSPALMLNINGQWQIENWNEPHQIEYQQTFPELPNEMWAEIATHLPLKDLASLSLVNKGTLQATKQDHFVWKNLIEKDFPECLDILNEQTYKNKYKILYELQKFIEQDSLEYTVRELFNLQELNLDGKKLTSIPAEIGNLQNLQRLNLNYNNLTSIPAEIGNLQKLQYLFLFANKLTSVPAEIGNLQNLQELYLGYNKLTSIPAEIGNLQNLRYLFLSKNNLTSIPAEVLRLQTTQNLKIIT